MRKLALLGLALAALAAAGCASDRPPAAAAPVAAARDPLPEGVRLEELPPQRLSSGQCAMVLWSRAARPERLAMALSEPMVVRLQVNGRLIELPLVEREGRQVFGHYPNQRYADGNLSATLRVSFDLQQNLVGGAVARDGAIELVDRTGWTATVPVGGLVACEP